MTYRSPWPLLALLGALSAPLGIRAQELNYGALEEDRPNRAHLRAGAEYGFVASAGYARAFPLFERTLVAYGDFTLPWVELDASDYRFKLGALLPIVGPGRWQLIGGVTPSLGGTKNATSRMVGVNTDWMLVGGYYEPHWYLAGELGFDWVITTHVSHRSIYRETVYANAKDGWYRTPGGNYRAGLQGGGSFGRYDLILRGGVIRDLHFNTPLLAFYVTLGFGARF